MTFENFRRKRANHGDDDGFEAVLSRIKSAGIPYRSLPHGVNNQQVNTSGGGKIVYWDEPEGHVRELLTKSYARAGVMNHAG